jgi:hypothetical protein
MGPDPFFSPNYVMHNWTKVAFWTTTVSGNVNVKGNSTSNESPNGRKIAQFCHPVLGPVLVMQISKRKEVT